MAKAIAERVKTRPVGQKFRINQKWARKKAVGFRTTFTNTGLLRNESLLQIQSQSPLKASPMRLPQAGASPEGTFTEKRPPVQKASCY
ncbi:hypothetical protein [Mangrovibacterium marinum]|uniref:hypothetical protein n=1 Tax=Mangrovibacterium marinum TaxID=1639118 RepID=UPI000D305AD6|nr:hypothetical protein [Mangrovibacterium marinum]